MKHIEDGIQAALIQYCNRKGGDYAKIFAIPNGGKRRLLEAVRLKKSGVRAGVSDLFLPVPKNGFHGFFIELKTKKGESGAKSNGKISDDQKDFLLQTQKKGYLSKVAHGFSEARTYIDEYLNGTISRADNNDFYPVFDRLQEYLENGATIEKIDSLWCLMDSHSECIVMGDTLKKMCVNLVLSG
jgi:hypothetical protein